MPGTNKPVCQEIDLHNPLHCGKVGSWSLPASPSPIYMSAFYGMRIVSRIADAPIVRCNRRLTARTRHSLSMKNPTRANHSGVVERAFDHYLPVRAKRRWLILGNRELRLLFAMEHRDHKPQTAGVLPPLHPLDTELRLPPPVK